MLDKLKQIEQRLQEVETALGDPAVYGDRDKLRSLSREQKELTPVVSAYRAYCDAEARIADNDGNQPFDRAIIPDGPAAYFSTVDVLTMANTAKEQGYSATVSNSAGAFVCNDVLYTLLHHFHGTDTRVGFIHVPWLPTQGSPSLPVDQTAAALQAMIRSC